MTTNIVQLNITELDGLLLVDSRLIAERLGIQHESFLKTIRKHREKVEARFGHLRFEVGTVQNSVGAVNEVTFVLLTEPQASVLMTLSKNTEQVVECKLELVEAFEKAKQIIKTVIPAQSDRIRELALENENLKLRLQVTTAEQGLESFRHAIVMTCPKPTVDKILGVKEVPVVEYRDRILKDNELINDGSTTNKTSLCHRYGIKTRNGKPDYKRLNLLLDQLPSEAFDLTVRLQDNYELRREFLPELDRLVDESDRNLYMGE